MNGGGVGGGYIVIFVVTHQILTVLWPLSASPHPRMSWVLWEEASDMELGGRTLFRMGLCGQEGREAG